MINKILKYLKTSIMSPSVYAKKVGVIIGEDCSIHTKHFGSEPYLVKIGDRVQIAENVRFATHGGGWVFRKEVPNFDTFGKIEIGNNVYIGNGSIILPGVTIGDNVVVGAGSVVAKSLESNAVYAGNPAKFICSLDTLNSNLSLYNVGTYGLSSKEKRTILLGLGSDKFIKK